MHVVDYYQSRDSDDVRSVFTPLFNTRANCFISSNGTTDIHHVSQDGVGGVSYPGSEFLYVFVSGRASLHEIEIDSSLDRAHRTVGWITENQYVFVTCAWFV